MSEPLSPFTKGIIIGLKSVGKSDGDVSEFLQSLNKRGARSSVHQVWKKWSEEGVYEDQRMQNPGRPSKLDKEEIKELKNFVIDNPNVSRNELQANGEINVKDCTGITLYCYLKEEGLKQQVVQKVMQISEDNKHKRVKWARKMLRDGKKILKAAIFSDESWIYFDNQYKTYQWVDSNNNEELVQEKKRFPTKILAWGAIHINGPLFIDFIEGSINSKQYINILNEFFFENDFISYEYSQFQNDNAPSHSSQEVKQYFQDNQIEVMDWPSQSPDLNPIENVWFLLKNKISKQINNIENIEELKKITNNIFMNDKDIRQCIINSIKSIPNRLNIIIEQNGDIIH